MFRHRPAMKFCVPFIVGISIGWQWNILLWFSAGVSFLLLCMLLIFHERNVTRTGVMLSLLLVCGITKITVDGKDISSDNISRYIIPDRDVRLLARVTDTPRLSARTVRFVVEAESVVTGNVSEAVTGGVLVSMLRESVDDALMAQFSYGNTIQIYGELALPSRARNPGEFDFRQYLLLNGVYAQMFLGQDKLPDIQTDTSASIARVLVYDVRKSIGKKIDAFFEDRESNFLKGLILGERSELPQDIKNHFIDAGVMHILAVSGLHIVIVTVLLMVVLQMLRIPERTRIVLVVVILIYYAFLTGGSASVVRSVIMAIVFLISKTMERKADIYNVLAFSAMLILVVDARQLFQPGFQLSYAAVFSLVYFYPKLLSVVNLLPDKFQHPIVSLLMQAISVTVAATIGTIPFSAYYFGKISIIGIVTNIFAVPLSNAILCLGMLTTAVGYCSTWIAEMYGTGTSFLTTCLLWSVRLFAEVPYGVLQMRFDPLMLLSMYGVLALVINLRNRDSRKILIMVLMLLINIWVYYTAFYNPDGRMVRVTFVDVGQGDAALVTTPEGENILIDAGPVTMSYDAGSRHLLPFFRWSGIDRLDAIIISHPHSDHLGGVLSLLRNIKVEKVIDAGSVIPSTLFNEYLRLLDSLNIPRSRARAGVMLPFSTSVRFYVVYPDSDDVEVNQNLNNQSVVVKMQYGETSVLFSGDAEREAEEAMIRTFGSFLMSDILKVGHHGSKTSTADEFLENVHPEIGIVSVGMKNKFRHPSEEVMQRLESRGCEVWRTDSEGAIIFESDGKQWKRVNWR